jgi:hypothetical protein
MDLSEPAKVPEKIYNYLSKSTPKRKQLMIEIEDDSAASQNATIDAFICQSQTPTKLQALADGSLAK